MLRHFAAGTTTAAIRGGAGGARKADGRSRGIAPTRLLFILCLAAAVFAAFAGSALAAQTHPYTTLPSASLFGACPNDVFRTGFGADLPDCRAYEQASPVDKDGGSLEGVLSQIKAADDGSGVTFYSQSGIPGGVGAQEYPTFMANRGGAEWSTHGLLPPQELGDQAKVRGFSPNLRYVATEVIKSSTLAEQVGENALLLEDTANHSLTTVVPFTEAEGEDNFILAGVSDDGSYVFFEAKIPLGSGAPAEQQNLFVWDRATGAISPVGILPAGEGGGLATEGSFAGPYRWWEGRLTSGGAFDNFYISNEHAISEDGDRAYYTAGGSGQLYLRSGLTGSGLSTVRVSASQKTNGAGAGGSDPFGPQPAAFMMATPNGSKALFMSHEELTNDAYTGTEDQGNNLYSYDAASGELVDLTPFEPAETETENGAEVLGVLGMSEGGSVIYFAANGVLASGAAPGTCSLEEAGGMCSIYRLVDQGGTPSITFVARVNGTSQGRRLTGDARNWSPNSVRPSSQVTLLEPTSRVSADGDALLFISYESLTGYDNHGCEEFGEPGAEGRCPEFYRYSATANEITCVSCNPTGAAPIAPPALRSRKLHTFVGGGVSGSLATQTRNLSADGNRIFFETPDPLVASDQNGRSGCRIEPGNLPENNCQDVYEWEAEGSGSCMVATAGGGCLYLISSGQSGTSSNIADIDASGENVFIFTESQLVPVDRDALVDVYDVRVNGGLASQHQQSVPPCSGEACLGGAGAAPAVTQPGSASFVGPGNPKQKHKKKSKHRKSKRSHVRKCKKRGGRCQGHRRAVRPSRPDNANRGGIR
jgi:hypothetical protein